MVRSDFSGLGSGSPLRIVLLLLRTTHPADLVFALTEHSLPRSFCYILLVTLQIIPDMSARATAILEAQRSRGLETQGGLRQVRALAPLVGPLVVGALVVRGDGHTSRGARLRPQAAP